MSLQVLDIVKIVTISKNKITSVAADSTHVYISCNDGRLMIYELIPSGDVQFIEKQIIPMFSSSKKGVIMMKCIPKWNLLFALDEKGVAIHTLNNLTQYKYIPNSGGCSLMAFDEARRHIVVACKRKLYIYIVKDYKSQSLLKEIILPDTILCMSFLNSLLFVGYKKQYCLVDIAQGRSCKDICEVSKTTSYPFCIPIEQHDGMFGSTGDDDDNENKEQGEMLLSNDRKGLFYDFVGSPARSKGQHLEWSADPLGGVYLCPYFLALVTTGIEVHNSWRYQRIQTIDFASPKMITEAHFVQNGQPIDGAVVCSQQSVIVLKMQPLPLQITTLISDKYKYFDDALTLCNLFPRGKEQLRDQYKTQISRLKGLFLFSEGKYDKAIAFLQRGMVPTKQVLSLYPSIIPDSIPINISPYPQRVFASKYEENTAIEALMPLLNSRKQQLLVKLQQMENLKGGKEDVETDNNSALFSSVVRLTMDNDDQSQIEEDLTVIDNVLLRSYIQTNRQAIIPLLKGPNHCSLEDSQKLLTNAGMEAELIALFSYHHKHDLAISQILSPLSQSTLSPTERQKRLQDLMHYLQQLGCNYQDLIFDCSRMFYKESRQLVLELFVGYNPIDGGERIDNLVILQHLKDLSKSDTLLENEWEKNALEITFLRTLIWEQKETNQVFHTNLIFLYTSSISSLQDSVDSLEKKLTDMGNQHSEAISENIDMSSVEEGLLRLLTQRKELLLCCKKELLEFLELSDNYDASGVLQQLDENKFLEERAIILSKLGEYLNALEIIAHRMGNADMAEAYCLKIYNSGKNPCIFLHLIKTYLFPSPNSTLSEEECRKLALRIFSHHVDKLNVIDVISLLPESTALEELIDCLEVVMTKLDEKQRNMLMTRKLAEVRQKDVAEEYMNLRNTFFENTNMTVCPICKRLIGDSVFAWNANGSVVHAACSREKITTR